MTKYIIAFLFLYSGQLTTFAQEKESVKNYVNTEHVSLQDAFPSNYGNVIPGCLDRTQMQDFKIFLKETWNIQLDTVKTLNIYFSKDERECKTINPIIVNGKQYFKLIHSHQVTSISAPLLFVKPDTIAAGSLWENDIRNYIFTLFFKGYKEKFFTAAVTINRGGIYFVDFEIFNPIVFNVFSNDVDKFSCE
jgi:hypothetical protein